MARPKSKPASAPVRDYLHKAKRKHIPPAGLAAQGEITGSCSRTTPAQAKPS